jgi:SAM-dependent methyltransferase
MPTRADFRYDKVQYPNRVFGQMQAERLAVFGHVYGLHPAPPSKCRFLDVGCGDGSTLIAMALVHPESEFVGFDLAARQISSGKKLIGSLGLDNVELHQLDLMEIGSELGEFDYIAAHGFFSWVSEPLRERLLTLMSSSLKPDGIGFISFNAYPFGSALELLREILLDHLDLSQSPEQIYQAVLDMLDLLIKGPRKTFFLNQLYTMLADEIRQTGPAQLFHDLLSDHYQPFYLTDFAALLEKSGLQFVDDCGFVRPHAKPEDYKPGTLEKLQELSNGDRLRLAQFQDFVLSVNFHNAVICKQGSAIEARWDRPELRQLHVSVPALLDKKDGKWFATEGLEGEREIPDQWAEHLLPIAKQWPNSVPLAEANIPPELLDELYHRSLILLRTTPNPCATLSEKPAAFPLARVQAKAQTAFVANTMLEAVPVNDLRKALLLFSDGSRTLPEIEKEVRTRSQTSLTTEKWHQAVMSEMDELVGACLMVG